MVKVPATLRGPQGEKWLRIYGGKDEARAAAQPCFVATHGRDVAIYHVVASEVGGETSPISREVTRDAFKNGFYRSICIVAGEEYMATAVPSGCEPFNVYGDPVTVGERLVCLEYDAINCVARMQLPDRFGEPEVEYHPLRFSGRDVHTGKRYTAMAWSFMYYWFRIPESALGFEADNVSVVAHGMTRYAAFYTAITRAKVVLAIKGLIGSSSTSDSASIKKRVITNPMCILLWHRLGGSVPQKRVKHAQMQLEGMPDAKKRWDVVLQQIDARR